MSAIPKSPEEAKEFYESLKQRTDILESRVDAFLDWRETVDDRFEDFEQRFDARSNWVENNSEEIAELRDENETLRNRLEAIETRVGVVEDGATSKEGKIRKIVAGAENCRERDQEAVVLDVNQIVALTGVSRRYAYDLIDDLPDEYSWIVSRQEARQRQFGNAEIDDSKQKKGIAVFFEQLHNDPEAVNKFTTTREGEEA